MVDAPVTTPMVIRLLLLIYIALIFLAEAMFVSDWPLIGISIHSLLIIAMLTHQTLGSQRSRIKNRFSIKMASPLLSYSAPYTSLRRASPYLEDMLPALALLPLMRILSVSLPIREIPSTYWYAIVGAPLLVAAGVTLRLTGLSWADLKLGRHMTLPQLVIAACGLPLGLIAFAILRPAPTGHMLRWYEIIDALLLIFIFVGFTEEIIFRGLVHRTARRMLGRSGIVVSSLIFAAMQTGYFSPLFVVFSFFCGVFFAWCVEETDSLWGVVIARSLLVIGVIFVYPILFSGMLTLPLSLLQPTAPPSAAFATDAFEATWKAADGPVSQGAAQRGWTWGPAPLTAGLWEPYHEADGGQRLVQYFAKGRLELTNGKVTSGLLARELILGRVQVGDALWEQRTPASIPVIGDPGDPGTPTYASFDHLVAARTTVPAGSPVIRLLTRAGVVRDDTEFIRYGVTAGVLIPETGARVASVFEPLLKDLAAISGTGSTVAAQGFDSAWQVTGFPLTDAVWIKAQIDGREQDVLVQIFERRVLTYMPDATDRGRVEMADVGHDYYRWRYAGSDSPA